MLYIFIGDINLSEIAKGIYSFLYGIVMSVEEYHAVVSGFKGDRVRV